MKEKLTNDEIKEVYGLLKDTQKRASSPKSTDNILEWSMAELRVYITKQTAGMKPAKKIKFAKSIMKEIEQKKKERDNQ